MRRYWIQFAGTDLPIGFQMGCGITAHTRDDALGLLRAIWPNQARAPVISDVSEDVDIRSLDQKHVTPNVGDITKRGVCFPNVG